MPNGADDDPTREDGAEDVAETRYEPYDGRKSNFPTGAGNRDRRIECTRKIPDGNQISGERVVGLNDLGIDDVRHTEIRLQLPRYL